MFEAELVVAVGFERASSGAGEELAEEATLAGAVDRADFGFAIWVGKRGMGNLARKVELKLE